MSWTVADLYSALREYALTDDQKIAIREVVRGCRGADYVEQQQNGFTDMRVDLETIDQETHKKLCRIVQSSI